MTFRQSTSPDIIGISTSQALRRFDLPLLRSLSRQYEIAQWEYCQDPDEAVDLNIAIATLHEYIQTCDKKVHLVGHGISGLLGWLYAKKYPERVSSITLLSVGINLATSWHSHYYEQRQIMGCSRDVMLMRTAFYLFGYRDKTMLTWLANLLQQDLDHSLIPHSLYAPLSIAPTVISTPTLICGATDDYVIGSNAYQNWYPHLKESDRLWLTPQGKHFFHYNQWQSVSNQIRSFWNSLSFADNHILCRGKSEIAQNI